MQTINFRRGNTVIEVLIATVVVALVLTAVAATITTSIQNSAEAENRAMALRLAQDSIEIFKNDKAGMPWDDFVKLPGNSSADGVWCYPNGIKSIKTGSWTSIGTISAITGSCGSTTVTGNNMTFNRAVAKTVSASPAYETITVYVYWNIGVAGKTRNVQLQQTFYKTQ